MDLVEVYKIMNKINDIDNFQLHNNKRSLNEVCRETTEVERVVK